MPGTYGHRPDPNVIVVGPVNGWYATWEGGEYIEVTHSRRAAMDLARHGQGDVVDVINTTGDTVGTTDELRREYVQAELRNWAKENAADYAANGY